MSHRVVTMVLVLCALSSAAWAQDDLTLYGYDALGRLQKVTSPRAATTYTLDAAGNRVRLETVLSVGNRLPVANPDASGVVQGRTVAIPVLANDTDADNDVLRVASIEQQGTKGRATVAPDGLSVSYEAYANTSGRDTVKYAVQDGKGGTAVGTITLSIGGGLAPGEVRPISMTASATAYPWNAPSGVTTFDGLRDGDFSSPFSVISTGGINDRVIADLGSPMVLNRVDLAPITNFYENLTGIVQYSLDGVYYTTAGTVANAPLNVYSQVSMNGVSARFVRVKGDFGALALGDFRIYATPSPTGVPPTVQNSTVSVYNASHVNKMPLVLTGATATSVSVVTPPTSGTAVVDGMDIYYSANPGPARQDSFTYAATNAIGQSAPATVSISILPPQTTSPDLIAPTVGSNATIVANASNHNRLPLLFSGQVATGVMIAIQPTSGTATLEGMDIYYTPSPGFARQDFVGYRAYNAQGFSSVGTITINIDPAPNPSSGVELPRTGDYGVYVVNDGTDQRLPTIIGGGAPDAIYVVQQATGGVATEAGGSFFYKPNAGPDRVDHFTFRAGNSAGYSNISTVTVYVGPTYLPTAP